MLRVPVLDAYLQPEALSPYLHVVPRGEDRVQGIPLGTSPKSVFTYVRHCIPLTYPAPFSYK